MRGKERLWIAGSLFVFSLVLSPVLIKAEILIKKTKHTDEVTMMGQTQPAKDEQGMTWLAEDRIRDDTGKISIISRFDLNKIYYINNSDKTYSEIDMPVDLEKILPPEASQMLQMIQPAGNVTDTGETQNIRDWNCKKYLVEISASMMGMDMLIKIEIWTSQDLGIDLDIYKKFYAETLSLNPLLKALKEECKKIDGYPVLTRFSMTVMGAEIKYQEESLSVENTEAPPGTYELPAGYTKTAFNPFQQYR